MPSNDEGSTEPLEQLLDRPGGDEVAVRAIAGRAHLVLRNEFATVWLAIDRSANGVRVVITDAEAETAIALDPLELEAISRMGHRDFDARILERNPDKD